MDDGLGRHDGPNEWDLWCCALQYSTILFAAQKIATCCSARGCVAPGCHGPTPAASRHPLIRRSAAALPECAERCSRARAAPSSPRCSRLPRRSPFRREPLPLRPVLAPVQRRRRGPPTPAASLPPGRSRVSSGCVCIHAQPQCGTQAWAGLTGCECGCASTVRATATTGAWVVVAVFVGLVTVLKATERMTTSIASHTERNRIGRPPSKFGRMLAPRQRTGHGSAIVAARTGLGESTTVTLTDPPLLMDTTSADVMSTPIPPYPTRPHVSVTHT